MALKLKKEKNEGTTAFTVFGAFTTKICGNACISIACLAICLHVT
jgi:hypothetical protein